MPAKKIASYTQHNEHDNFSGIHSQIGIRLRAFYTEIQDEEIPPKFLHLLEQLDKAEQQDRALQPCAADEPSLGGGAASAAESGTLPPAHAATSSAKRKRPIRRKFAGNAHE